MVGNKELLAGLSEEQAAVACEIATMTSRVSLATIAVNSMLPDKEGARVMIRGSVVYIAGMFYASRNVMTPAERRQELDLIVEKLYQSLDMMEADETGTH